MNYATMSYSTFITKARSLSQQSEKSRITLMKLLVDVYHYRDIWKDKYKSWGDLLKAEGLPTIGKFNAFLKGLQYKLPVDTLGVDATCLLATYPKNVRSSALATTLAWVKGRRVAPKYQLVAEYVKGFSKPQKATRVQKYKAYIAQLQAILNKHRIQYPSGPLQRIF